MTDLTYRGVAHHGDKHPARTRDTTLNYRGATYNSALAHHDKPRASHTDMRYRGIPQHD
ncbi:DUF4278 domain-containing protein [Parvibaculum sp.]|uniref:DUF4278 domain-containing protein n=1 Tax=Parvibaculum sp. TaxID=2024848 RepID=UPI0027208E51|nr:DUF4278 domain-containing protein [Parvibaculum sp.]MDO9127331.1 DUF4278 domain-containing protein [Parvibaculum sp.]MDP1625876.1 DUF4278 domain-containing protein [Parvibaculum sp.]MDP2148117.1 DUF4278 domain-containing protein [Parvibaculum sp.]MDP3329343.1 DUF4278 domain-containing protein [Parvibaculum sp.]